VDDVVAVLREMGLAPKRLEWEAPADNPLEALSLADWVSLTRRRLCLPATRDPEIATALVERSGSADGRVQLPLRSLATLWWAGSAI
jgi:hypothetical protein